MVMFLRMLISWPLCGGGLGPGQTLYLALPAELEKLLQQLILYSPSFLLSDCRLADFSSRVL